MAIHFVIREGSGRVREDQGGSERVGEGQGGSGRIWLFSEPNQDLGLGKVRLQKTEQLNL